MSIESNTALLKSKQVLIQTLHNKYTYQKIDMDEVIFTVFHSITMNIFLLTKRTK